MEPRARADRIPYDFLRLRPEFRPLNSDPRLARILQLSRVHFDELVAIIDRARNRGEFPALLEQPLAQLREQLGAVK